MNRQFHNKRQSLAVTGKHAGVVKKIANLTGKLAKSHIYLGCKIFRILLKYVTDL